MKVKNKMLLQVKLLLIDKLLRNAWSHESRCSKKWFIYFNLSTYSNFVKQPVDAKYFSLLLMVS